MPVEHHIFPEVNLVVSRHRGSVGDEELICSYEALCQSEPFGASYSLVVDLRQTNSAARSTDAIRTAAQELTSSAGRIAIVAPSELSYGLSRMYQALSELSELKTTIKVLKTWEEALAWLEIPLDAVALPTGEVDLAPTGPVGPPG